MKGSIVRIARGATSCSVIARIKRALAVWFWCGVIVSAKVVVLFYLKAIVVFRAIMFCYAAIIEPFILSTTWISSIT